MNGLTKRQQDVIRELPGTAEEIASSLNISKSSVYDHISNLQSKGITIPHNEENNQYGRPRQMADEILAQKDTREITREANNYIEAVETAILTRLMNKNKLITQQNPQPGNEDMVLHVTDLHVGDVVTDDFGTEIYNTEISINVMNHITRKTLELKNLMSNVATFDTIHVLYGGDMITNENAYGGQGFEIDSLLADQMSKAVRAMTRQIKSFAEHFDVVNVICQVGNHGKTGASGTSKQANMDLVCYRWVDDRLRESDYNNINFVDTDGSWFKLFQLRGGNWKGLLIHGNECLPHIGTDKSRSQWRGWLHNKGFDVAYRGHHHESRREAILNGPMVYESPSTKPTGNWAEKIGKGNPTSPHKRLATTHGVSDKRPVTWEFVIDDSGMD